jgi:hypothetical protein
MSKASKKETKQKNLIEKRKRKAANRARYDNLAKLGQNTKSTRARRSLKKKGSKLKGTHPYNPCGNLACKKCYSNN